MIRAPMRSFRKRHRRTLLLVSAVLGLMLALASAVPMLDTARAVDVLALFGGAFGAGAAFVAAIHQRRSTEGGSARPAAGEARRPKRASR